MVLGKGITVDELGANEDGIDTVSGNELGGLYAECCKPTDGSVATASMRRS